MGDASLGGRRHLGAVAHSTAPETGGGETYSLGVVVGADVDEIAGSPGGTEVGSVAVSATGVYEVPLSGTLFESLDADAAAITCQVTVASSSPSIAYGCYLAASA